MSSVYVGYKNILDDKAELKEIEANSLITAAYRFAKSESDEIYKAVIDEKVALTLNGELVEVDKWKYTTVEDGDKIEIISKLSGGKGKFLGFLMIALGVAAIVFAPYIAPLSFGTFTITQAQIAMMGISWVLSGITRLMFSPDLPNSTAGGNARETQTYSWSGIKTTARSDTPIPIVYGTCMTGGNVISAFTDIQDNDNYLNLLIALGEGEIEGICKEDDHSSVCTTSNPSDASYVNPAIYVNDQPLRNYDNVEWWYRTGTNTQTKIPGFDGSKEQFPDGRELTTDWIEYTTTKKVDSADIHLNIPSLYDTSGHAGINPASVTIYAEFKEESEGSYHSLQFVRWQPHYQNSNGWMVESQYKDSPFIYDEKPKSYYIKCVSYHNTIKCSPIRDEPDIIWIDSATLEIKDDSGNIEYEEVHFSYNGGNAVLTKVYPYVVHLGSSFSTWVTLHVYSTSTNAYNYVIRGLTKSGIIKTLKLDFNSITGGSGYGKYTIRLRRASNASTSLEINNNIYLKNVIEVINGDLTYPNTALLGLRIKATDQLSGGIPNIRTLIKGLKIDVPDHSGTEPFYDLFYNETLDRFEYEGAERTWDGVSYTSEYSENSMLCVRDLVVNDRYGIGKYLSTSDLYNTGIINAIKSCHKKWYPTVLNYLSWYTSESNWNNNWNFIAGSGTNDASAQTISPSGNPSYSIQFKLKSFISPSVEHDFKITLSSVTGNNLNINLYGVRGSDFTKNVSLGSLSDKGDGQHTITFTPTVNGINSILVVLENKDLANGNIENVSFTITAIELKNSSTSAEHYHTMNGAIDSKQSATTALFEACDSFRCWPVWFKGTYNFVLNEDVTPTHNITAGNIKDFKESFTPLSEVPYKIYGEYLDKDLDYEMKSIVAKTTDSTIPTAREKTLGMKWLNDRKRVERELKFKLNAVINTKLSINFKCGLDSIHATAGDVVNIQHPLPQWGSGGRLLSYNEASAFAVLDEPFTFDDVAATYLLKYQTSENSYVTATVDTSGFADGDSSDKIPTISWPASNPVEDSVYLIGSTSNIKPFRLIKVSRNTENEVEVDAVEHLPSIYSEQDIVTIRDNYSQLAVSMPAKPNPLSALYIKPTDLDVGIGFEFTVDIGQQNVQDVIIQMSTDQIFGYKTLLVLDSNQKTARYIDGNLALNQTYYFKAFCRNGSMLSDPLYVSFELKALDYIPPAPTGIHLKGNNPNAVTFDDKDIVLQWNPVGAIYSTPGPLSGYVVEVYHTSVTSSNLLRTAFVKSEEYTYTLGNNISDSSDGNPYGKLIFVLYTQTNNNILSKGSIPFKIINPVPATVSGLTANPFMGGVTFSWNKSTEQDHKNYKTSVKVESEAYRDWNTVVNNSYTYSVNATDKNNYSGIISVKLRVKDVDSFDQESAVAASLQSGTLSVIADNTASVGSVDASNVAGWAYSGDTTQINGESIAVNTLDANKLNVVQLSAITANMGELTSGVITGAEIRTASSGHRISMNSEGIRLETGATTFTWGDSNYLYGDSTRKYGTGVLAYIQHNAKEVPFYIQEEQNVADFHYYNRSTTPTGSAEIGDVAVVNGILKICTVAGTPGTWEDVGKASGFVDTSGVPTTNDYARFVDTDTIEGRSYSEVRSDLGLYKSIQDYSNSLSQMVSEIGATKTTVYIDTSPNTLTSNLTIPSNIHLIQLCGAITSISSGITLTINGCFEAGVYQVFDGDGDVSFGSGAVTRTYSEWWQENTTPGTTDMSVAIQKAVNSLSSGGIVRLAPTKYYLNTAVTIPKGVIVLGSGYHVDIFGAETSISSFSGIGTWICIDNTTIIPFSLEDDSQLRDLGMFWVHAAPGAGWSPTVYQKAIDISANDIKLYNLMLLNPYIGIVQTEGSGDKGRLEIDHVFGQPFSEGLRLEYMTDVCRLNNIHFWPYWSNDSNVKSWQQSNTAAFQFGRMDNPQMSNLFSIWSETGIEFYSATNGVTSKFHCVNIDIDLYGTNGILVSGNAVTGQLSNYTGQADGGTTGLLINGDNCRIKTSSVHVSQLQNNGIRIDGTGNRLTLENLWIDTWNISGTGFPGVEVATGNTAWIGYGAWYDSGNGAANTGGAGTINSDA